MPSVDAAVVTGAGRGIGRAVALSLAEEGIPVLCIARTSSGEETVESIRRRSGTAEGLIVDLADYARTEAEVRAWLERSPHRRLGAVLAAAHLGPKGPLAETSLDDWEKTLRVNVLGNLAVVRALVGPMVDARFGRLVFFAGGGAAYPYPLFPAYAGTKTAIVRVVENLAADLKGAGDFGVVCLAPGAVETNMLADVRRAGGEVRTATTASESQRFVSRFFAADASGLSGRFVHVRDDWAAVLDGRTGLAESTWTLRRVE